MNRGGELPERRTYTDAERKLGVVERDYLRERNLAFHDDPDKAKIRRRAKRVIAKRFGEVLLPHGFEPVSSGTGWALTSRGVSRSVGVQASTGGARCYINVARVPNKINGLLGQKRSVERLDRFCPDCVLGELDQLYYFDVEERPHILDKAVDVLSTNVLPWLIK